MTKDEKFIDKAFREFIDKVYQEFKVSAHFELELFLDISSSYNAELYGVTIEINNEGK